MVPGQAGYAKNICLAAPENSTDVIKMNQLLRIEDADGSVNDLQMPFRFYPALVAGLAFYLSQKRAPERVESLKSLYEDEFARALAQDESRASLMVKPNMRSYGY